MVWVILRSYFRLILGYCTGTAVDIVPVPPNADQSDFTGYEAEHPIDRQIMRPFAIATCSGVLPSGQVANIPTLDRQLFWKNQLHEYNGRLAGESAIGGPNGPQPGYVNDRIMESFGSYNYPYPFMAVDEMINGAKGRIMQLQPATAPNEIDTLANNAVQQDTDEAADRLLQAMRIVSRQPLILAFTLSPHLSSIRANAALTWRLHVLPMDLRCARCLVLRWSSLEIPRMLISSNNRASRHSNTSTIRQHKSDSILSANRSAVKWVSSSKMCLTLMA